ncbi:MULTISPECIES: hypothetical protein [unclassified Shewanella]|uniref:hypothetical protein n=1 Tax=Shewanella TaxID=22 RepID=UPI00059BF104|nr:MULTISPECIES: hypothetical protein [unclassified Shewanella]MCU7988797.1 hypothetical protein [Shewanella sp. SW24]MCU8001279.1 hypothetical protein [Shewanella sp. SM95]MCU8019859.1 hypothetical protein [Shewanella sp. SM72]MCU8024324.1 hypothetical protein [Shewanella sp. SM78]MCU8041392.1 hypothetical protein [Shewanella sp. SM69]
MHKFGIVVFMIAATVVLIGGIFQRHAIACDILPLMNYQRLNSEVFLAGDFAEQQAQIISELIDSASERISHVYGKPISKPRFVIAADIQGAANWGANETASMHRMPWRACIIIGPKGQNVDVIAHEWLHAEIQHRVGFFRFLKEIPVWFDEGAALTLDYRKPFLPENINLFAEDVTSVKNLKSGKSFFSNNIRQNYQASRIAVEPLIRPKQFFNDLEKIASGESFENVFLKANK